MTQQPAGNILVVDDEELIRTTLHIKLSQDGYSVTTADSGESALESLKINPFDVVLSDLKLIGMDGIEVLKQAKQIQPNAEVVIITGYASLESAIEALRHGAYDYLVKPINHSRLRIVIKRCLEKKQLLQTIKTAEERIRYLNGFYESLLNHLDDAIFVVDHHLELINYNRIAAGWGRAILGCETRMEENMDFNLLAPRFCKMGRQESYEVVLKSGSPVHFEDEVSDPPGKRFVLIRLLPMTGHDATNRQVLTVITDITALKILEMQSLRGKKLEGITQAAITLNHEINNPLGIILGNTNLLMSDCNENQLDQKEKLKIIHQQTMRISEITRKLSKITQPYVQEYFGDKLMIDMDRSL